MDKVSELPLQEATQHLEHGISSFMSMGVVKTLEVVKVQHDHTKGNLGTPGPLDFDQEGFLQITPIE